ncbi:23083_t:CDS:2, partial [Gigaspora rosea]
MVVYRLHGGQHGYRGNIINFPQDIEEFTIHLSWHPFSLNVLIICQQSNKDFKIHQDRFIDDQLQVNQLIDDEFNEDNEENGIIYTFVPYLPLDNQEEIAINNTINKLLANNTIEWPKINNNPINEVQTSGYIA